MNETLLRNEIQYWEGIKYTVYLDSLGKPTVGIGHYDPTMIVGQQVIPSLVDMFYKQDSYNALQIAQKSCNNFSQLDDVRARLLVALCFNMGNKILQFKHMLAAIQSGDFDAAANELQNSLWFTQVGRRGPESVEIMRSGNPLQT